MNEPDRHLDPRQIACSDWTFRSPYASLSAVVGFGRPSDLGKALRSILWGFIELSDSMNPTISLNSSRFSASRHRITQPREASQE
ncbi:hypothetical protein DL93DRAFT_2081111 [Clavulina sp. PMI_390]|nr:hypothetical protein DL93DRAFT_2081111 [Clavulina sp. PMI_390]